MSLAPGEARAYRVFWALPKDAAPKKLVLCADDGHQFAFDVGDVK